MLGLGRSACVLVQKMDKSLTLQTTSFGEMFQAIYRWDYKWTDKSPNVFCWVPKRVFCHPAWRLFFCLIRLQSECSSCDKVF